MLTRDEMSSAFAQWGVAWDEHDLDGVMDLFHDEIYFENWTGGWVRGKENLRQAWTPWFCQSWRLQVYGRRDLHRRSRTKNALSLAARLTLV